MSLFGEGNINYWVIGLVVLGLAIGLAALFVYGLNWWNGGDEWKVDGYPRVVKQYSESSELDV